MSNGVNWGHLGQAPRTGITVACIKAAAYDLQDTINSTTTSDAAWAIYEDACRLAATFATLVDEAGSRAQMLDGLGCVGKSGRA
jgi:hypothetical protein